jgi:hypothetical protein
MISASLASTGGEQLVETAGGVEVEPAFTAGGAFLHGHVEHDGDATSVFGELGSPNGSTVALVTDVAGHQRLLR